MLGGVVTFLIILLGTSLAMNLFQFLERLWWRDALSRAMHEILELRDRLEQRAAPPEVAEVKAALREYHRAANAAEQER